jgi:hypothetical protein
MFKFSFRLHLTLVLKSAHSKRFSFMIKHFLQLFYYSLVSFYFLLFSFNLFLWHVDKWSRLLNRLRNLMIGIRLRSICASGVKLWSLIFINSTHIPLPTHFTLQTIICVRSGINFVNINILIFILIICFLFNDPFIELYLFSNFSIFFLLHDKLFD